MKAILTSLLILAAYAAALAQASDSTTAVDATTVYDVVDVAAEPIGGMSALFKSIASSIQYPADARKNGITGKVFVEFIIEADGTIRKENIRIVKPLYKSIDKEAQRIILLTSPWAPAKKGDKNVRSRRTLPLSFNM